MKAEGDLEEQFLCLGELAPFLQTDIEARVPGYIEKVLVDRGSKVRKGSTAGRLSAPEMAAQTAAAESALHQAEAEQSQAEAQAAAVESTYVRPQRGGPRHPVPSRAMNSCRRRSSGMRDSRWSRAERRLQNLRLSGFALPRRSRSIFV